MPKLLTGLRGVMVDLEGEAIVDGTEPDPDSPGNQRPRKAVIGKVLANILARARTDDPVRAMELARSMYKMEDTIVDDADIKLMEQVVKDDTGLTNLGQAEVLSVLRAVTDPNEEKGSDKEGKPEEMVENASV